MDLEGLHESIAARRRDSINDRDHTTSNAPYRMCVM